MMNENLPNGIPPQHDPMKGGGRFVPFNGVGSSHSSRDSSPGRPHQIPLSQLPPGKMEIPAGQLPPRTAHLPGQMGRMSLARPTDQTPYSSPKIFTSTPILEPTVTPKSDVVSPIVTSRPVQKEVNAFTHSSTSQFASVKTTAGVVEKDGEGKKVSSFFSGGDGQNLFQHGPKTNGSHSGAAQQNSQRERHDSKHLQLNQQNVQQSLQHKQNQNLLQESQPGLLSNKSSVDGNAQSPHNQMNLENNTRNLPLNQQNLMQHNQNLLQQNQHLPNQNPQNQNQPSSQQISPNLRQLQPGQASHQQVVDVQAQGVTQPNPINMQNKPLQNPALSPQDPSAQQQIQCQGFSQQPSQPNLPQSQSNQPQSQPNLQSNQWGVPQQNQHGFPSYVQQQTSPANMATAQQAQQKSFGGQAQPGHQIQPGYQPSIQPHLQQQNSPGTYQQGSFQQPRMPPLQSTGFPPPNTNMSQPPVSEQNKAHLHANRYPQRPNVGPLMQGQLQQTNFNLNQNQSSSYQSPTNVYQNQTNVYQAQMAGEFQNQQTSGYQPPSTGYQPPSSSYQLSSSGYQSPSPYQNQPNFQNRSVTQSGFNKLWGNESFDLLQCPNILPQTKVEPPKINLGQEFLNSANCSPDIIRCTMTKIPESTALLQKSRLPLGVLIHPFKDLSNLPVIQCNTIVRCRTCRTYINPFVFFVDSKRWKCNLCYRVNELPEEFQYDPVSKTYGDPSRRPEVRSSTIEYIAPAEYMLRPPQPAIYLYLFDVSRLAVETGYLHTVCNVLSAEINSLPGDARTQIGFLCYDSCLHFYSLSEGQNQPHEMTVLDIDDIFIPCPDNLLVNLQDRMDLIADLLTQLPARFANTCDTGSALGAALQAAFKMTSPTGGRITVFQTILPNKGPGAVVSREDPNQRSSTEVHHLNPANDFYKRLALECSGQQVAVDLFILNSQYVDLATISGISRFSGGCIYHFPLFKASRTVQNEGFERAFRRYVTRKIGFEAVMRIRCTRGLSIHTFHGNFFVRSTDLLSLPNINPDAGFGMQVSIEENLSDVQTICFQAALLYTSSKGERRIRVHTICLPVANTLHDIMNSADEQCIIGLLAKMAVDRSMQSSLSDAREAFLNVAIDILTSYKISLNMGTGTGGLMAPGCLKLLPLYISALLKSVAFRVGTSTRLDDRVRAMCDMKTKPLPYLIQQIYPDLYAVHNLEEQSTVLNEEEEQINLPPHLQLTARNLDSNGAYLMDTGDHMVLFVCANVSQVFLKEVLDAHEFNSLSEDVCELPTLNNATSRRMQMFLNYLNDDKPYQATFQVIKENSPQRVVFLERLIEDRLENSLSYHEFLQHVKTQVK